MGITAQTMTLLSTLAALVIIANSLEEDFEPDYRDIRPRRYDTVTTNYEQPWRVMNMEPAATQPTQADWGFNSQEEPPKRRRPGRKRKRRPPPTSEEERQREDLLPQERHVYHEEYRPYQHEKLNTQGVTIRRRRKQFDSRQPERPNVWNDDTVDADRPLVRKRGNKRKRPSADDTWPELSEFSGIRPNDNAGEYTESGYIQPTESTISKDNHYYDDRGSVNLRRDETVIKSDSDERYQSNYNKHEGDDHITQVNHHSAAEDSNIPYDIKEEDKSLSEFSLEIQAPSDDITDTQEKLSDKTESSLKDIDKAKNNETLDSQTLKEILKKSNGRSLSEILQQHNLTLVDLLHRKEKAISILTEDSSRNNSEVYIINNESRGIKKYRGHHNRNVEQKPKESVRNTVIIKNINENKSRVSSQKPDELKYVTESVTVPAQPYQYKEVENIDHTEKVSQEQTSSPDDFEKTETTTNISSLRRRFPVGSRKKLRMRPMNNTSYKSQLNRDLIALTSRRYQLSRNTSRSRDWKDMIPTLVKIHRKDETKRNGGKELEHKIITTTSIPEETTVELSFEDSKMTTFPNFTESEQTTTMSQPDNMSTESTQAITIIDSTVTENIPTFTIASTIPDSKTTTSTTSTATTTTTEKSTSTRVVNASDLRRQAFNNRLKRKRLKQKTTTTEATQEYDMKNIFGMANLVSASEFIAKVQPRTTSNDEEIDFTTLEDFITTESSHKFQTKTKPTKTPKTQYLTSTPQSTLPVHDTEETAKIEIEEILNDTLTSARLSKILMERNMTVNELVEHRERGSSNIHLADIFHNASREPNPPEPFLSKSLIEPISKETYPLRALLEANLHDPTAKATPLEPNVVYLNNINIPVVMDFGNNVNENGENMGIMSLFDNFTKTTPSETDVKGKPIERTTEKTETSGPSGTKPTSNNNETSRESRTLNTEKDLVTWKEIIAIMHRGKKNNTKEDVEVTTKEISPAQVLKKIVLDDLADEDNSMVVVNNLNHLNDVDDSQLSSSSEEIIPHTLREKTDLPQFHGIPNSSSNSAKSVTVATASIIGLAMVLFILTYVAFKWKQQRSLFRDKESLRRDRIPTPVFENRKGHKINSSTRSKSPMISTSNIYTIETSEMRNDNDSPEYMWDSLRKPFQ